MLGRMRRAWDDLTARPGLEAVRLFALADLDPVLGGTPRLSRWGLLCLWRDERSRGEFLGEGAGLRPLIAGAQESCHLALETMKTKDSWCGWSLPREHHQRFAEDEPALVMTHARLRPGHLGDFTWHNARIVRSQAGAPGLLTRMAMFDSPMVRATLSLWRTERDAIEFAYRSAPHAAVQKLARRTPWADDFFFARFRVLGYSGTWGGRDLLAGLSSGRAPAPRPGRAAARR